MSSCPSCHTPVSPKTRFCPLCGGAVPKPSPVPATSMVRNYDENDDTQPDIDPAPAATAELQQPYSAASPSAESLTTTFEDLVPKVAQPKSPLPSAEPPRAVSATALSDDSLIGEAGGNGIALLLRFPWALVTGHTSIAVARLENHGTGAIDQVELLIGGRALAGMSEATARRIPPGLAQEMRFEIDPVRAGRSILQIELLVHNRDGRQAFRGTIEEPVHSDAAGGINISIGDIQGIRGEGANAGLGADYRGDVNISNLLGEDRPLTLNELLTIERDVPFTSIQLELDYGLSSAAINTERLARARPLSIPREFLGHAQTATRCRLESVSAATPGSITLVVTPNFSIGRNRRKADFTTWWMPRSESYDERTRRISQQQVLFAVDDHGIGLWDPGSTNGSTCDGLPLAAGSPESATRFERRAALVLAGDYTLDAEHDPGGYAETPPRVRGIDRWAGFDSDASARPAVTGSVSFKPTACLPPPDTALWLLTDACFGNSEANPLVLTGPSLAEVQGRFHCLQGNFWIESIAPNRAIRLGDRILQPGEIAPLTSGQRLHLGETEYRLELA